MKRVCWVSLNQRAQSGRTRKTGDADKDTGKDLLWNQTFKSRNETYCVKLSLNLETYQWLKLILKLAVRSKHDDNLKT